LQTGDPDFTTPQPIIDAAYQSLNKNYTHYSTSKGSPRFRAAIAKYIEDKHGVSYDPDNEILITNGAIHAYYAGMQAILNPGDSVLIVDPSWQTHTNIVTLIGGTPIRVPSFPANTFFPTTWAWEDTRRQNTRAIVLNTPSNPTGMVAQRDYLVELVNFAVKHDLYIVSDEVYDHLVYDDVEHVNIASIPGAKERTLYINSFSKTFAMTGWRIGYLSAPAPVIESALKVGQHSVTNVAEFVQHGAMEALTNDIVDKQVKDMRDAYARRRQMVLDIAADFGESPVKVIKPTGAFYFFLDVRKIAMSSAEIAERLLEEAHVAIVPGSNYGSYGEGFLRMTIAASDEDVTTGFRRILEWAKDKA